MFDINSKCKVGMLSLIVEKANANINLITDKQKQIGDQLICKQLNLKIMIVFFVVRGNWLTEICLEEIYITIY